MSSSLSIKNVPDETVERLRKRAKRNHRSLQGELMTILEEAVGEGRVSFLEAYRGAREATFRTPSESVAMIREDRDAR